jgi:dimethylglycine dehydrogenase
MPGGNAPTGSRQTGRRHVEEATQTWNRAGPWEPRIREECEAVRDHVGVLDLPGFSRFDVEGPARPSG